MQFAWILPRSIALDYRLRRDKAGIPAASRER
jgi:hypothetical protein